MVNNGTETSFTPIITTFDKNETLEWLGSGLGGLFKGTHYFKLSGIESGKNETIAWRKIFRIIERTNYANNRERYAC